uniref:Leucine-rich repeat-containing N-terminal plant-type domain-containing protein n=1 Tax=Oryza punctata TaxID=4537 RepID=A0A0E0K2F0_ORYPU
MADRQKCFITQCLLMLLYSVAAIVALPARPELSHRTTQNSVSHNAEAGFFPNERLYRAYLVIQRFKGTITSDPKNVTGTWTGYDICGEHSYVGFYCGTPFGQDNKLTVTAIFLNGFGLKAPKLQGFIDQLPDLAFFHAASNDFGSDIPLLTGLEYLYELNVDKDPQYHPSDDADGFVAKTTLTGKYGCVNANINLNFRLGLGHKASKGHCGISGCTTDSKALLLNHNNISGSLPANIGFSKLSYLALANNKLTGPIPPSIGRLQDTLREVLLRNNQFSGCLPHELGKLTKATVIDASMNQLTGSIPLSFSCLTSVEQLSLARNRLYGAIPDALCKLASGPAGRLANLTLSSNYFTSVGPACLLLIKDGVLDVNNNCIPGFANQRRPVECASFLSQPKMCIAASTTNVACPAAAVDTLAATPASRVARDYSSYVTYATLHG